jgi:hypothetical protein
VLTSGTLVGNNGAVSTFSDQPFFIAARAGTSLFDFFGIDDVRIYSGDLSASVTAIFNDQQ